MTSMYRTESPEWEHITPESFMYWMKSRMETKRIEPSYDEWRDMQRRCDQAIQFQVTGRMSYNGWTCQYITGNPLSLSL